MLRLTCAAALLTVAAGLAHAEDPKDGEAAKEKRALLQTKAILTACEAYYVNPNSGNKYPTGLVDLIAPPWGGASFFKDPANDAIDPWGRAFKYEVVTDVKGNQRAYVWSERTVDGKTKVIGTKPPEPKK